MLQSGGHNHKWPATGPGGHITLAAFGVPDASKWKRKSRMAQKWAERPQNTCVWGVNNLLERETESKMAPLVG